MRAYMSSVVWQPGNWIALKIGGSERASQWRKRIHGIKVCQPIVSRTELGKAMELADAMQGLQEVLAEVQCLQHHGTQVGIQLDMHAVTAGTEQDWIARRVGQGKGSWQQACIP